MRQSFGHGRQGGAKMVEVLVVPATRAHAASLLEDVREVDLQEWFLASLKPGSLTVPLAATTPGAEAAVLSTGEVLCIWGVSETGDQGVGSAWLIATNRALRHVIGLHRHLEGALERMHARYPTLVAWAFGRNAVHLKWLRRLGFQQTGRLGTYELPGFPFIEFKRSG